MKVLQRLLTPPPRSRAEVRLQLQARCVRLDRSGVRAAARFEPGRFDDFLRFCDQVQGLRIGPVRIEAEDLSAVDFAALPPVNRLPVNAGTLYLDPEELSIAERKAAASVDSLLLAAPDMRREAPSRKDAPGKDFNLFDFLAQKTRMKPFGKYRLGQIKNPSKLSPAEQAGVVDQLNFMKRTRQDMYAHVIAVDETAVFFDGKTPVAFASINELPFVFEDGRGAGVVIPLVGTAVKKEYRIRGLQTQLNIELGVSRWLWHKLNSGLFSPLKFAVRTRNAVVIKSLFDHFSRVRYKEEELSSGDRAARTEFARYMGCSVEKDGVVKNAYESPISEEQAGLVFSGKKGRRVREAAENLGQLDSRIFICDVTIWSIFKVLVYSYFSKRRNRNGG